MSPTATRRECLLFLLGGIATTPWAAAALVNRAEPDIARLRRELAALFWDRPGAHALASACRRRIPDGHGSPTLVLRAILGHLSIPAAAAMTTAAIRQVIAARIQLDLQSNDTACVDGWILSTTEAHLYTLAGMETAR
jgi:hypothetical protein